MIIIELSDMYIKLTLVLQWDMSEIIIWLIKSILLDLYVHSPPSFIPDSQIAW